MAILNYIKKATDVASKNLPSTALIFTEDGHIITHGVDYYDIFTTFATSANTTYTFASGTNGSFTVTPNGGTAQTVSIGKPSTAGTADKVSNSLTFGTKTYDGSVAKTIALSDLGGFASNKVVTTSTSNYLTATGNDKVYSIDALKAYVENVQTQAMIYKGSINKQADIPTTNVKVGDTYKIATAGKYKINGSQTAIDLEVGDTLVCEATATSGITWTVLQNNIDTVSDVFNGTSITRYGSGSITFFAPTTSGSGNTQALVSGGSTTSNDGKVTYNAPKWTDISPSISYDGNNKLNISVLGKTMSSAITVKTTSALSVGTGLQFNTTGGFNGSAAKTISLKLATTSEIGGIQISSEAGSGHTRYVQLSNKKAYVTDTWRDIYIGTDSLGDNTLKFDSGSSVVAETSTSGTTTTISYDLRWWNLDTGDWES